MEHLIFFQNTAINSGLGTLVYALAMSAKTSKGIIFRIELDLDRVFNAEREYQDRTQD